LDVPKKDIVISSLLPSVRKIKSVELLGSTEKIIWTQTAKGLQIKLSKSYPTEHAVVFKVE